jgi:hypothetical protein
VTDPDFSQLMAKAEQIRAAAVHRVESRQEQYNHTPDTDGQGAVVPPYAGTTVEAYYADIVPLYRTYALLPDPAGFDAPVDGLGSAMTFLDTGTAHSFDTVTVAGAPLEILKLNDLGDLMPNWRGAAATDCLNNFINPLAGITGKQFTLVSVLKVGAEAQQALWRAARTDVLTIADRTLAALDAGDCPGQTSWTMLFSILGAIATVAAGALTGPAAPITWAVVGATISLAGSVVPLADPDASQGYGGDTTAQIIGGMKSALAGVIQRVDTAQQAVSASLAAAIDALRQHRDSYEAARPTLLDDTSPAELRQRDELEPD